MKKIIYILLFSFFINIFAAEEKEITKAINQVQKLSLQEVNQAQTLTKQVKIRPAYAFFRPEAINTVISQAILHETKSLKMSIYDAVAEGNYMGFNPILKSLATRQKSAIPNMQSLMCKTKLSETSKSGEFCAYLNQLGVKVKETQNLFKEDGEVVDLGVKDILHQKFYLFKDAYQGKPMALIGSFNPTKHANTPYQLNNMVMLAIPSIYNGLNQRFNNVFKGKSTDANYEFDEEQKIPQIKKKQNYFEQFKLSTENTDNVELLKTPLNSDGIKISDKIIESINKEEKEITIMQYQFSHARIVSALCRAAKRGVKINLMINDSIICSDAQKIREKNNASAFAIFRLYSTLKKNSSTDQIKLVGNLEPNSSGLILHNKCFLMHSQNEVITGSFNCSGNSDLFAMEANVSIKDPEILQQFIKEKDYIEKRAKDRKELKVIDDQFITDNPSFLSRQEYRNAITNYSYKVNGWLGVKDSNKIIAMEQKRSNFLD